MKSTTQQRILDLGMTAPSIDNSQPFYFQWDESRLYIFRDAERDRKRGNTSNCVSMVALGCLVECIAIAASGEHLVAKINFTYNRLEPEANWVIISFLTDSTMPDELLPGLKLRHSDRRRYQGGSPSDPIFRKVLADADRVKNCTLHFRMPDDQMLIDYLIRCEAFFWADRQMLPEMLSWVRWNRKEVQKTRDGMPWQSMDVSYPASRMMKWVASSKRFRQMARSSGIPLKAQQNTMRVNIQSSAALGCITVMDTSLESMFQLGRLFLRAWVRLNLAGYGVQVMANPSVHVFQTIAGIIPQDYPEESKQVFVEGKEILANAFDLQEGEIPAWMFRTGKSSSLPDKMKTLRLPQENVVRQNH